VFSYVKVVISFRHFGPKFWFYIYKGAK